ncbi:glycosyltransferase [Nocardioides guangzhouensis]|uniref:Glycosyltransferase n=1 Tax=Nocardioides guangzhouensis TaxID=2497878 RepID=A0A4Q4Z883_9ACTN|nr:glycosyltransferase [Nocardioides guangzhouensis]RYP84003.1 glycosyltransferase [Nocardioides guangzhouensis]
MKPSPRPRGPRADLWSRLRFLSSWVAAVALLGAVLPRVVDITWHGVLPVLGSVPWRASLILAGLWLLGLYVHSFVLTAAAPSLTRRRALTLNLTGSAVSNVVPLGGAAGVELNRRMMRAWGIDGRAFTGFTFLTNLWDVGSKLLLPVVAAVALARAGEHVAPQVQTVSLVAGVGFVVMAVVAALVLVSPRGAVAVGQGAEAWARRGLRMLGRDRELGLAPALLDVRDQCAGLVAQGWLRMSAAIAGYVALQGLLLGFCLHLTGGGNTWPEVLAAFAVERALTIVPLTPGGVGVADLGLVGVLLTLGGDPASVTAAAVLYRAFIFAVEIPVGSGTLGVWLLGQRLSARRASLRRPFPTPGRRIAHVTDVFLPRLGGIETHVDELARQQRARGLDAEVLTPPRAGTGGDPSWVRRVPAKEARRLVTEYDVVHVHVSMFSPYGIAVARASIRLGVPVLVTVHSMWSGAGGILRLAALAGVRRWPVAWSAVSGAAAGTFGRSLGGVEIAVLPNAVDTASWRPSASVRGPGLPQASSPVTLVSVMRLMPRKRPLQLLRVFEQVRRLTGADVRLVVVGDGPLRRRLERHVRHHGLGDQVRITGRLPRDRVAGELATASVYVAPAPRESFGIAALEARCAGLPVVARRGSGVGELVRDRVDGILVDDDAGMAVALAGLVRDPALRERIAAHNRAVVPGFDWTDVLDRTAGLYRLAAERVGAYDRATGAPAPVLVGA